MTKAGKGNKTVSVILPEEVYQQLKQWAQSKDWSVSQAGKNLIMEGLSKKETSQNPQP